MSRISRRLSALALIVAVAGLVGACDGGSSSTASSSASPSRPAATGATSAAAPTGGNATQFCTVVREQQTTMQGTDLANLLSSGDPAAWKTYLDKTAALNQQMADAAPPEIKPSVKTLQAAAAQLRSALAAAGYDVSKVGATKLVALLQTKERMDAVRTLSAYVKKECAIDLSTAAG
jgi:hypothetical protein